MTELTDTLEAEIATRLDTISGYRTAVNLLETEVDALQAALAILAVGGDAPPETVAPDPGAILRKPPAKPPPDGDPDPELVADFQ